MHTMILWMHTMSTWTVCEIWDTEPHWQPVTQIVQVYKSGMSNSMMILGTVTWSYVQSCLWARIWNNCSVDRLENQTRSMVDICYATTQGKCFECNLQCKALLQCHILHGGKATMTQWNHTIYMALNSLNPFLISQRDRCAAKRHACWRRGMPRGHRSLISMSLCAV